MRKSELERLEKGQQIMNTIEARNMMIETIKEALEHVNEAERITLFVSCGPRGEHMVVLSPAATDNMLRQAQKDIEYEVRQLERDFRDL